MPPRWLLQGLPIAERLQAEVQHPVGFPFLSRDEPNDILVQPFLDDFCMYIRGETELIFLFGYLTDKLVLFFHVSFIDFRRLICYMIVKAIDVNIASKALGGIVEDGKLGTHEETLPVEAQLVVATQLCPLLAVGAIIELCHVASYVEVGIDAQPEDGRSEGYGGYHLVGNLLHFLFPLRQLHRLLIQREY